MAEFRPFTIGKYTLLDRIAAGGMAELHRALISGEHGFEKLIAIKRLLPHLADEEAVVTSFIDEAKLAALLQHRNIVQIYDFGSMEGTYFIAMEYLSGKDLHALLKSCSETGRRLGVEHAVFIALQVCEGLDYAHRLKDLQGTPLHIIHRDVSPQNVFIHYDGEVKIIDFGIAKAAGQSTKTQWGMLKGKVAYMSPEQAQGVPIDHRSDIFATGILLYEMVTGVRMFSGEAMEVLSKVREAQFAPPETMAPDLPPELFGILHRALAADPEKRYSTCSEMAADLEECLLRHDLRPTSQGLARFMKDLFEDDMVTEELTIQEVTRTRIPVHGASPENGGREMEKTALLVLEELPRGRTLWKRIAAVGGPLAVLLVLLFLYLFKDTPSRPGDPMPAPSPPAHASSPAESTAPNLMEAGRTALAERRFDEATALFEDLLRQDPLLTETLADPYEQALLGQAAAARSTDPYFAENILKKAVRINPRGVQSRFQLGLLYLERKDYPNAIDAFQDAAEVNPSFADTYFNLGYVHAMNKDYDKAQEMYGRVVELAPMYLDEAYFNLAMVQEKAGKTKDCIVNLEQALAVNPENALAAKNLQRIREMGNKP